MPFFVVVTVALPFSCVTIQRLTSGSRKKCRGTERRIAPIACSLDISFCGVCPLRVPFFVVVTAALPFSSLVSVWFCIALIAADLLCARSSNLFFSVKAWGALSFLRYATTCYIALHRDKTLDLYDSQANGLNHCSTRALLT